ncbi:unnamed protein product [Hermetia illucens]|uniref:Uncharacterized protein n=1 Tax=Hermetia illucens TaxID=343691 RepID=A0A7R8UML5_HERIL|nr:unnamed protein product [Hermetia illucens]
MVPIFNLQEVRNEKDERKDVCSEIDCKHVGIRTCAAKGLTEYVQSPSRKCRMNFSSITLSIGIAIKKSVYVTIPFKWTDMIGRIVSFLVDWNAFDSVFVKVKVRFQKIILRKSFSSIWNSESHMGSLNALSNKLMTPHLLQFRNLEQQDD